MEKVKKTKEEGSKVQWGRGRTAEQRQYSTCIYFRLSVFFLKCAQSYCSSERMTAGNLNQVTCHLPNPTAAGLSPSFRLQETATPTPTPDHLLFQIPTLGGNRNPSLSTSAVSVSAAAPPSLPPSLPLFSAAQICLFPIP